MSMQRYVYDGELYDPILVKMTEDSLALSQGERVLLWKELSRLPEEIQRLLVSDKVAEKLTRMREAFRIDHESMLRICVLVRHYYFRKISLEDFRNRFAGIFGGMSEAVRAALAFVEREVFTLKPDTEDGESYTRRNVEQVFILDALAKYPRLNDQAVTNERIRVKSEKEPVRPTVRNWLRAYRDVLGVRAHTAMERGQFLFGSENTKKLSSEERERLAVIFKSLDENEPLGIDPAKQEIVFPEKPIAAVPSSASSYQEPALEDLPAFARPTVAPNANPASAAPRQASPQPTSPRFNFSHTNPSPAPAIRFSTGHVLPAEKEGSGSGIFDRKPSATPVPSQSPATGRPPQALPVQNRPGNPSESGHTAPSTTSVPHSSFRISPSQSSMGRPAPAPSSAKPREVWQVPQSLGNVVDLRPKE
jgi:hypothetical protein